MNFVYFFGASLLFFLRTVFFFIPTQSFHPRRSFPLGSRHLSDVRERAAWHGPERIY